MRHTPVDALKRTPCYWLLQKSCWLLIQLARKTIVTYVGDPILKTSGQKNHLKGLEAFEFAHTYTIVP